MPHHVFARQALYDRVRAEPMHTVARTLTAESLWSQKRGRSAAARFCA